MAKAVAACALFGLGAFASMDAPFASSDPPVDSKPVISYVTVTERESYQGRGIHWWASRAVANRRQANTLAARSEALRSHVRALQRHLGERWNPTVTYAIGLASRVFGVSESKMRAVAWCESTFNPFATNGRYRGIFQLGWSPFGYSPYDPVAAALSTAQTVVHDGGWRQWSCG